MQILLFASTVIRVGGLKILSSHVHLPHISTFSPHAGQNVWACWPFVLTAHVWTRSYLGVLLLSVSASLLEYIQLVGDIAQGYYDTHMAAWGNEPCPAMPRKKIVKRCDKVMNWTSVRVAFTFFHFFIDISKLPSVRVFIYHHLSLTTLSGDCGLSPPPLVFLSPSPLRVLWRLPTEPASTFCLPNDLIIFYLTSTLEMAMTFTLARLGSAWIHAWCRHCVEGGCLQ